jgi:tetratricopeptide (TPR) repeat protein
VSGPGEVEEHRHRLERLRSELDTVGDLPSAERVRVRDEIVNLYRDIERQIAALEELKEGVRPLVDRYKEIFPRGGSASPPVRIDHLGSSTYRERGWSALAGADYERAARELAKAIELDPENDANLSLLAWAYLRLDHPDRARPMLERVLERQPGHPLARTVLGYLRMREGQFAEAIENLSSVVREGTDATATLYANLYMGIVYAERDMHRDAQAFFRQTLCLGPNLTEAYWELGRSYEREGRAHLALEAWQTGAGNRFSPWGDRCREAAERLEGEQAKASRREADGPEAEPGAPVG